MEKQVWYDIYDEMRGHHAGLIWRLENIELDQKPARREWLEMKIDFFKEIISFISNKT